MINGYCNVDTIHCLKVYSKALRGKGFGRQPVSSRGLNVLFIAGGTERASGQISAVQAALLARSPPGGAGRAAGQYMLKHAERWGLLAEWYSWGADAAIQPAQVLSKFGHIC